MGQNAGPADGQDAAQRGDQGIAALVVEALTVATLQGVRREVLAGLFGSMDRTKFSDFTDMCIRSDVLHAERRAVEIDEIAEDVRAIGFEPIMTSAAGRRLWASPRLDLREAFLKRKNASLEDVLDAYAAINSAKQQTTASN